MTTDQIYQQIVEKKPKVIYISGKTSTGKSTFSRRLRDELGYQVIELEAVLLEVVEKHGFDEQSTFRKVLYEQGEFKEKDLFLEATDMIISEALSKNHPLVIEGAVANTQTLRRILQPASELYFLYFHPANIDVYIRNLTSRFMQSSKTSYGGLPLKFWQLVNDDEFHVFCDTRKLTPGISSSISRYAQMSQAESLTRLDEFNQEFKDIIFVEI